MIEVKNLTKKFKETVAVDNINFEVKSGEVFGCLGHNGAGKTTTIRLILGLLQPTEGKALVWGKPLSQHPDLRCKVGVLLENDGLYENLTGVQNLNYYASLYDVTSKEEQITGLLDFTGLANRCNDKVGTYSRGMRRKLGLARAILHKPSVLLLDEPSAGLDPEVQKMVRDLILNLAKEYNMLIFLNSHDLDEVERICSRVVILQRGKVVACDSLVNLRRQSSEPAVEITLAAGQPPQKAVDVLSTLDRVNRIVPDGNRVTVTFEKHAAPDPLPALIGAGIKVEEVKKLRRSLEDVYLEIIHREEKQ
ncbi:MAG: ABC transporter ATP-binding protein [Dehalococcoidaceae bacterium]|nr:ABC transporter ATP-binding protein [Dehalococcoidaceae bacterium]